MCAMLIDRKYIWREFPSLPCVNFIDECQIFWLTHFIKVHKHRHKNHKTSMRMVKPRKKGNNIMRENYEFAQKCIFHILQLCYLVKVASCVCMCCIFNWFCSITKWGIFVIWNQGNFYCIDAFVSSSLIKTVFHWIFRIICF